MSDGQKRLQDEQQGQNKNWPIGIIRSAAEKGVDADPENADDKDQQCRSFQARDSCCGSFEKRLPGDQHCADDDDGHDGAY